MATAVTLKESDGSEIYPVTDISLVNGGISAHDILPASSVAPITSSMIDWQTYYHQKGETLPLSTSYLYWAGRQRVVSGTKTIEFSIILDKPIASDVTSVTFTPSGYNEAYGANGLIYSINNPTSSQLSYSCTLSNDWRHIVRFVVTIADSSISITSNACCVVKPNGSFTFN